MSFSVDWNGDWEFFLLPEGLAGLIREIDKCLDQRLYYAAINLSLTIPDICSTLGNNDLRTNPARYEAWGDEYVLPYIPNMTGKVLYMLRCGVSHNARFWHRDLHHRGYNRAIFSLPDGRGNTFVGSGINDAFFTDAEHFCRVMVRGVENWYRENIKNPNTGSNCELMLRYRPNGFSPYISGMPVIG